MSYELISELMNCVNINDFSSRVPNNQSKLTMIHINIRSLIKNFILVKQMIDISHIQLDIIILTEVGISDCIASLFKIPGYNMINKLRNKRKGGGIVMYVHHKLHFNYIN